MGGGRGPGQARLRVIQAWEGDGRPGCGSRNAGTFARPPGCRVAGEAGLAREAWSYLKCVFPRMRAVGNSPVGMHVYACFSIWKKRKKDS